MEIKFKNNFLHLIIDNGRYTTHYVMIAQYLNEALAKNNWNPLQIEMDMIHLMNKYHGKLNRYHFNDPSDKREAIYIQYKNEQILFLEELNAMLVSIKLTGKI